MSRGQSSSTIHHPHRHHDFAMDSFGDPHSPTIRLRPQPRFHGDGLDLRRPIMSIPEQPPQSSNTPHSAPTFIDLTGVDDIDSETSTATTQGTHRARTRTTRAEPHSTLPASRLPRYPDQIIQREVIDLENEPEQEGDIGRHVEAEHAPSASTSPEIEFLHARSRPAPPPPPGMTLQPLPDTVIQSLLPPAAARSYYGARSLLRGAMVSAGFHAPVQHMLNNLRMNYSAVGFNLAQIDTPEAAAPAPTAVEPLPPAREGFTRSPDEENVLICPSCLDELSVGGDDVKRQVWVVKACGHVYCGGCAKKENRSGPNKKRSSRTSVAVSEPRMFTKCLVDGCGKSVTAPKAMIQLFL